MERPRLVWDLGPWMVPAWGTHSWAGQGSGELETGPPVAMLGQELMALGADMRSWGKGRVGEPWGVGRDRQAPRALALCNSHFLFCPHTS